MPHVAEDQKLPVFLANCQIYRCFDSSCFIHGLHMNGKAVIVQAGTLQPSGAGLCFVGWGSHNCWHILEQTIVSSLMEMREIRR